MASHRRRRSRQQRPVRVRHRRRGPGAVDIWANATASASATIVLAVLRFLLLGGLLTGSGLLIGALLVVPERRSLPLSMLEFAAWLVVAFVAFADIWVQAGLTGASFGAALNGRYGILHLTLTIAALLAVVALSRGRRQWELLVTAAIVALLSESLAGHAATGRCRSPARCRTARTCWPPRRGSGCS